MNESAGSFASEKGQEMYGPENHIKGFRSRRSSISRAFKDHLKHSNISLTDASKLLSKIQLEYLFIMHYKAGTVMALASLYLSTAIIASPIPLQLAVTDLSSHVQLLTREELIQSDYGKDGNDEQVSGEPVNASSVTQNLLDQAGNLTDKLGDGVKEVGDEVEEFSDNLDDKLELDDNLDLSDSVDEPNDKVGDFAKELGDKLNKEAVELFEGASDVLRDDSSASCAFAIAKTLVLNGFPAARLLRIKRLIDALGGVKTAGKLLFQAKTNAERLKLGGQALKVLADEILGLKNIKNSC